MEAVECGAASLSMILRYHGRELPLDRLRSICDVSRDGSKAGNILRAARLEGLEAKGYKMELEALANAPMPAIIHWNFNHFLVLEGSDKKHFHINDPALGHRKINHEEFSGSFTGVILTFKPTPAFEKTIQENLLLAGLKERIQPHKKAISFLFLVGLFLIIPGILIPGFSRIFVDTILIKGTQDWLWPLMAGMGFTLTLRFFLDRLKYKYLLKTNTKIDLVTTSGFFWHVLSLPVQFFSQRHPGEIGSRIGVNGQLAYFISGRLANTLLDGVSLLFFMAIMWLYSPTLTLIGVGLSVLNVFIILRMSKSRGEDFIRYAKEEGALSGISMAGLQTIETLKSTGRESDFFSRWSGQFTKVLNAEQRLAIINMRLGAAPELVNMLLFLLVLIIGSLKVMSGEMTMGMLVAFQSLMASFIGPVNSLIHLRSELLEMEGDMTRMNDIMKTESDPQVLKSRGDKNPDQTVYGQKLEGYIDFKNVTFGYSQLAPPLIEDFSLSVSPGQRIALVGGSGSGKSTLAKVLVGLYPPTKGRINFDGVPAGKWAREVLNNSVAMVDQDIFLFEGTIREILTFWDEGIPDHQVIAAAKDAEIHDLISSKKEGYDFVIREGGTNLSGGQRQRIEIARALVGNPSILILDEATSALDPPTEKLVYDNIKKRRCTVIVVAHRLSTIRDSDEIIMLDQGKIVERGTHSDLVKQGGKYYALIKT